MDEAFDPEASQVFNDTPAEVPTAEDAFKKKGISVWVRWLVAYNPLYILSAVLLLYGLYRVSTEPRFLSGETAHLIFNLSSLQCYEWLVIVTAIVLARREIWYDSMLLVGLENMLLLVPFILISQAALIDRHYVWAMSLAGGVLAVCRFAGLKRFITKIRLSSRLLVVGFVILAVNMSLPVIYRILHESKFGTQPDWGAAFYTNEYVWLVVLPAICWLADFVPFQKELVASGDRWLPIGWFALWLGGTGIHLHCLGYVYDFPLRCDLLAPAIWALSWIVYRRVLELMPQLKLSVAGLFLVLPALVTFLAASSRGRVVFLVLSMLNATIYQRIYSRHTGPRLVLHLLWISLGAMIAMLPQQWGGTLVTHLSRVELIGAGITAYLLVWTGLSTDARLGVLGTLVAGIATNLALLDQSGGLHWAAEIGIAFLLLHSLRWPDEEHAGAKGIRYLVCFVWVTHAIFWMHRGGAAWMTCEMAVVVLCGYLAIRLRQGIWGPRIVPAASLLVALSAPGAFAFRQIQSAPAGVVAIIAGFLVFGLGTWMALTKHRWNGT